MVGCLSIHKALSALHIQEIDPDDWLPDSDSGASSHMSGNRKFFTSLTNYHGADTVMVGNGQVLPITAIGSVSLSTTCGTITLHNVLLVPSLKQNLLSISQLTTESSYNFVFTADSFSITHRPQEN